jgi:hypothetical protein
MGQAFLVYYAWRAFAFYITTSMEMAPITYKTFTTIFLARDPHGLSIARLIWEFSTKRGLPSRVAMAFIILNMIFVLLFPTLASAMTGYQQNSKAYVKDINDQYVPFPSYQPVLYTIADGKRVNLTDRYLVHHGATSSCISCLISMSSSQTNRITGEPTLERNPNCPYAFDCGEEFDGFGSDVYNTTECILMRRIYRCMYFKLVFRTLHICSFQCCKG